LSVSNLPVPEQHYRASAIKRRLNAKQGFRCFEAARRTISGYEVMHMIRKGSSELSRTLAVAYRLNSTTFSMGPSSQVMTHS
jgi:transposase-like protein